MITKGILIYLGIKLGINSGWYYGLLIFALIMDVMSMSYKIYKKAQEDL